MRQTSWSRWISVLATGVWPMLMAVGSATAAGWGAGAMADMVLIKGGTFSMGDVFGEGNKNELPVHEVTLSDFYLSKYEVTVGQLTAFIKGTGYRTSAEAPENPEKRKRLEEQLGMRDMPREKMQEVYRQFLQLPGAGRWYTDRPRWGAHEPGLNWRNPGFQPQIDSHPVVAVSWNDAADYCNWLSRNEGLPEAYDLESGSMLDEEGNPTDDVRSVKGYRLPTEAEWEFAARERGRKVRFGNGQDIARSSEINFRADTVMHSYAERGDYRRGTAPVGSLLHNSLGLYDMSGNAWEWTSDCFKEYGSEAQTNPHPTGCEMRALRGGRWGGDAAEIRVSCRNGWYRNDRCNNSGFRIARTAF